MRATANDVLTTAFNEVGYVEKPVNITKYAKKFGMQGAQWCQIFVWWVFNECKAYFIKSAYTPTGAQWFMDNDQWHTKGTPKTGDIVYFDFPNDNLDRISHVGICVKAMTDHEILCIEGNTSGTDNGDQRNGGMVAIKLRHKDYIVGWGRPKYRKDLTPIVSKIVAYYDKPDKKDKIDK
jgi:surface antigen